MDKYILNGKVPEKCNDIVEWSKWFENANRHITVTKKKNITVSTIFLGLDHSFGNDTVPTLFETMIFGGKHNEYQERYSTWEKAEEGHKKACKLAGI